VFSRSRYDYLNKRRNHTGRVNIACTKKTLLKRALSYTPSVVAHFYNQTYKL